MAELNVSGSRAVENIGSLTQKQVNNNNKRSPDYFDDMQGQNENKTRTVNNAGNTNTETANSQENNANINENTANAGLKTLSADILHRALRDAEIEVTQYTMDIVKSLINGSLPLTEKNITDLLLLSYMYKDTPLNILTVMMKLEIPMTQENVRQFENMIILQEKLSDKMETLIKKITTELFAESRTLGELSSSLSKILEAASVLNKYGSENIENNENIRGIYNSPNNNINFNIINIKPVFNGSEMNNLLNMLRELRVPESLINLVVNINRDNVKIPNSAGNLKNLNNPPDSLVKSQYMLNVISRAVRDINAGNINNIRMSNPNLARQTFEKAKILFESPEFQKLLKSAIEDKLFISPKNLSGGQIEKFYNGLNKNLNELITLFSAKNANQNENTDVMRNNIGQNPMFKYNFQADAKSIKDSLSFMNEINKTMPFLQIPLKLPDKIINSDLYIFKNKKKKVKNGENSEAGGKSLNALIKLELERLGNIDIYINMAGKNVRSKFFAAEQKTADEINKNLRELNDNMTKMGFNFTSGAVSSDSAKSFDFIDDFINREMPRTEVKKDLFRKKI